MRENEAVGLLVSTLDEKVKKEYAGYEKQDETLILHFHSSGIVHNLTMNKASVLEKFRTMYKNANLFKVLFFKYLDFSYKKRPLTNPYREKSTGDWEITCTSENLRKHFEQIQQIIKQRREIC